MFAPNKKCKEFLRRLCQFHQLHLLLSHLFRRCYRHRRFRHYQQSQLHRHLRRLYLYQSHLHHQLLLRQLKCLFHFRRFRQFVYQ
jgi:hypothetical protein